MGTKSLVEAEAEAEAEAEEGPSWNTFLKNCRVFSVNLLLMFLEPVLYNSERESTGGEEEV